LRISGLGDWARVAMGQVGAGRGGWDKVSQGSEVTLLCAGAEARMISGALAFHGTLPQRLKARFSKRWRRYGMPEGIP
jgi:hypothetical protein